MTHATTSPHPLLAAAFAGLDAEGIAWCLLRGDATLADPPGDVDVLVAPDALHRLDATLRTQGFLRLQRWGAGGHRHYLGYHQASDRWLELDVESDIEFGPTTNFLLNWVHPTFRVDAVAATLHRRRRSGAVWVPDDDDAFWLLLLHCIVDKAAVAEGHALRLFELLDAATPDGPIARPVTACCPPGWDAASVLDAVRQKRFDSLVTLGAALAHRAAAERPVELRVAAARRGVRRLGATLGRLGEGRGVSVALLGPDGAGKSTLAAGLVASLELPARLVYMGLWQGEERSDLPASYLRAALRPVRAWRRAAVALYHQCRGRVVVFDRHPYDALLPPQPPHVAAKRLFFWFLAHCVPHPTLVLVLDLPGEVAFSRRPEEDREQLDAARRAYLELGRRQPNAHVIDAQLDVDDLRTEATGWVWRSVLARSRGRRRQGPADLCPAPPRR